MDWDAVGAIGEVVGATAVVATLFYLSVQIRNSTLTQKASTIETIWAEWRQHQRQTYIEHPENIELYVSGLRNFAGLSAPEKRHFTFILSSEWLFIVNVMKQYGYGNLEREDFEGFLTFWFSQICTPGGAEWWEEMKGGFISHDVETLESFRREFASQATIFEAVQHFDPDND